MLHESIRVQFCDMLTAKVIDAIRQMPLTSSQDHTDMECIIAAQLVSGMRSVEPGRATTILHES